MNNQPQNGLPILEVVFIVIIGWLVISVVQHIFLKYILIKINSFWGLVGIGILLLILYLLLSYVSGAGSYFFPFVDPVNPKDDNFL
jgi:hypothetical protein